MSYGETFVLLAVILPTFGSNFVLQFLFVLIISAVIERLDSFFVRRTAKTVALGQEKQRLFVGSLKGFAFSLALAAVQ